MKVTDHPHFIYRCYDWAGELLYVGLTVRPDQRVNEHRLRSPWGKRIARYTILDVGTDRVAAHLMESAAILMDQPTFNRWGKRPHQMLAHTERLLAGAA